MLFGELPIKKDDEESTLFNSDTLCTITGLKFHSLQEKWSQVPKELQELLSSMLSLEPEERPSLQEILEYPWLEEAFHEDMPSFFYSEIENMKQNLLDSASNNKENLDMFRIEEVLDTASF